MITQYEHERLKRIKWVLDTHDLHRAIRAYILSEPSRNRSFQGDAIQIEIEEEYDREGNGTGRFKALCHVEMDKVVEPETPR